MIMTAADGIGKKTTPKESDAARSCSTYPRRSGWPCSGGEEVVVGVEDEGKALPPHDNCQDFVVVGIMMFASGRECVRFPAISTLPAIIFLETT